MDATPNTPTRAPGKERRRALSGIHIAVILQGITALVAVVAVIIAVSVAAQRADNNATAIRDARYQSCQLIVSILHTFSTRHGRQNARTILALNPELLDCSEYSLGR